MMLKTKCLSLICIPILFVVCSGPESPEDAMSDIVIRRVTIEQSEFIQIPGPNPITRWVPLQNTGTVQSWNMEMKEVGTIHKLPALLL